MNVTQFLALKIAEAAIAVAEDAEHIAEEHGTELDAPCYQSLQESGSRLALIMITAAQNGVIPHGSFEEGEALKVSFRQSLTEEIIDSVNKRRIVLDRALII